MHFLDRDFQLESKSMLSMLLKITGDVVFRIFYFKATSFYRKKQFTWDQDSYTDSIVNLAYPIPDKPFTYGSKIIF